MDTLDTAYPRGILPNQRLHCGDVKSDLVYTTVPYLAHWLPHIIMSNWTFSGFKIQEDLGWKCLSIQSQKYADVSYQEVRLDGEGYPKR